MRNTFNDQLAEMHSELQEMGGLCEEAIATSIRSLSDKDPELIKRTAKLEEKIDRAEKDIETLCLRMLLLQTPIASDLRHVSAAMKMVTDMERIGDQASDIAEIAGFIGNAETPKKVMDDIHGMANDVVKMVREAVASFISEDIDTASKVIAYDDAVDDWFNKIREDLVADLSAGKGGEVTIDLLMIAKYLERLGDHATNLAEWVQFSATGTLPG